MTHEDPATFSVEVLAFPGAGEDLASSIADAFGIPSDDAQRIVESAPVAVKKGADADTTREIAKVLLGLGAEICIRNERTGEKKIHRASSGAAAVAPASPVTNARPASIPPRDALPSSPPGASARTSSPPWPEPLENQTAPASVPPPGRSRSNPPASSRPPPPSQPPPAVAAMLARSGEGAGPKLPALDTCAACARKVEKSKPCTVCGWSNERKRRFCRECRGELAPSSKLWPRRASAAASLRSRLPLLGVGVLAVLGTGAALYFLGPLAAAATAAAFLMGICSALAFTTVLACGPCRRPIHATSLQPSERKELLAARRRWILAAVLSVLVAAGAVAPVLTAHPELTIDSFGIGWSAPLPWSHRAAERGSATIQTDWGSKRVAIARARNPSFEVIEFCLAHTLLPEGRAPELDDPATLTLVGQMVAAAMPGVRLGETQIVDAQAGRARQGTLNGSVEGRAVGGRARVFVVERDVFIAAFVAAGSDPGRAAAGLEFLDRVHARRGP